MLEATFRYPAAAFRGLFCPRPSCLDSLGHPKIRRFVRHGSYYRKSDRNQVTRFRCLNCHATFSRATLHPCYRQKRRDLNFVIWNELGERPSDRGIARKLGVSRTTVAKKARFLATQARLTHAEFLRSLRTSGPRSSVQFDEMETFEHTRCKPLSIPLIVDAKSRIILGVDACSMPPHGRLARISFKKYGPRPNHRMLTLRRLFRSLQGAVDPRATFRSDSHPYYPPTLRKEFPQAQHHQEMSRRATVVGLGELKEGGWDPLFTVNQTAAMFRDRIARLSRRTWITTKKVDRLRDRLILYAVWHNRALLLAETKAGPPSPKTAGQQAGRPV